MKIDVRFAETGDSVGATRESGKYGAFGPASPTSAIVHDFVSGL
jgi:hypothetical protein